MTTKACGKKLADDVRCVHPDGHAGNCCPLICHVCVPLNAPIVVRGTKYRVHAVRADGALELRLFPAKRATHVLTTSFGYGFDKRVGVYRTLGRVGLEKVAS